MTTTELERVLAGKMHRSLIEELIEWTIQSKRNFKVIMDCFTKAENKIDQRAAWVMSEVVLKNPEWVKPYWGLMLSSIEDETRHSSIRRNVFRVWQELVIPEEIIGPAVDCIFRVVRDPNQDIAVRAFGLKILANACDTFPELKTEVALVIEDILPYASSGLKNRCLKMLKKISA